MNYELKVNFHIQAFLSSFLSFNPRKSGIKDLNGKMTHYFCLD